MKKITALFAVALLSISVSNAAMTDTQTTDIDILRSQGYSETALRAIDTVKANNQGPTGKYQRYFVPKKFNIFGRAYTNIKTYVDTAQDDGRFGQHQINFTNTFMDETAEYSYPSVESDNIENL
jgi:hypothetical protein